MKSKKYFFFTRSKNTFELASKFIKLDYVWDKLRGAGWSAVVELDHMGLVHLHVKLWNKKYQLLKVR